MYGNPHEYWVLVNAEGIEPSTQGGFLFLDDNFFGTIYAVTDADVEKSVV